MKAATGSTKVTFSFRQISIHAAREGGDSSAEKVSFSDRISIHAAREGGDFYLLEDAEGFYHFNPRRP